MIERLREISNANVYFAKMDDKGIGEFELFKLPSLKDNEKIIRENFLDENIITINQLNSIMYENNCEQIYKIEDISKHSIVVFQSSPDASKGTNDDVYLEFDYVVDKIVYDVMTLNNGLLPKINLISHSRGGITNLQYALEHPDLVDSMFSLGTPFLGSNLSNSDILMNIAIPDANINMGIQDIVNANTYLGYQSRWNTYYNELYKNINVHAIGGYSTIDFLFDMINNDKYIDKYIDEGLSSYKNPHIFIKDLIQYLHEEVDLDSISAIAASIIVQYLDPNDPNESKYINAINLILDSIRYDNVSDFFKSKLSITDDLFVDLESQLGTGYTGFKNYRKQFEIDNCNLKKIAQPNVAIVHNLESRDNELLNYIISEISLNSKKNTNFETYIIDDEKIGIKNYIGKTDLEILAIPSEIDGRTVIEIGDFSFANNFNNNISIKKVFIPNSVEKIGKGAFRNCKNLTNIELDYSSMLKVIDDYSFENCHNLINVKLPDSLREIGRFSFKCCHSIQDFQLPQLISSIDDCAFVCSGINEIKISEFNSDFIVINNTLFNYDKTKLIYSYSIGDYVVPPSVKIISEGAFYNNKNLVTIDLSNTLEIGDYAFYNCSKLVNVIGDKINKANKVSFYGTLWYKNLEDIAILGNVLLNYSSNLPTYVIPNYVTYIGRDSFENTELETIYVHSNINSIPRNCFSKAFNLENVYLLNEIPPTAYDSSFPKNENLNIFVPEIKIDNYKNNSDYKMYINKIKTKNVSVNLLYEDGGLYDTIELSYFSIMNNINYPSKEGYIFKEWQCIESGNTYTNKSIFKEYSDSVNLIISYELDKYKIYLSLNDGKIMTEMVVKIGEKVVFPVYEKEGYDFIGWYAGSNNNCIKVTDNNGICEEWNVVGEYVFYALYEPKIYGISYILNEGENCNNPLMFVADSVIELENPIKIGYRFDGWLINGEKTSIINRGIYENIIAEALWSGTEIKLNYLPNSYDIIDVETEVVILDFTECGDTANNMVINVGENITHLTLKSNDCNKSFNICINVLSRNSTDLNLTLINMNMKAPNGYHCIDASSGLYTLKLHCIGNNSIVGGDAYYSVSNISNNGFDGINAYKLFVYGDSLMVFGGTGANGENGFDGEDGQNGLNTSISGGDATNGENGSDGEDGLDGGHGGYAVYTISTFNYNCAELILTGGNGGSGGTGGNGGDGGRGGDDDDYFTIGKPGDGGIGGTGGNGGDFGIGQNAFNGNIGQDNNFVKGENGSVGNPGFNGNPGSPGDAGLTGEPGKQGGENLEIPSFGLQAPYYYVNLNCKSTNISETVNVKGCEDVLIKISIECRGYYTFETSSAYGSDLEIYNKNEEKIEGHTKVTIDGKDKRIIPLLEVGTYYIKVINLSNIEEAILIKFKSQIINSYQLTLTNAVELLSHMHDGGCEVYFSPDKTGFYYISLIPTSDYEIIFDANTIQILDSNRKKVNKIQVENYICEAVNKVGGNKIAFYAEKNKKYYINIFCNEEFLDTLTLKVEDFDKVILDEFDNYSHSYSMVIGDNFKTLESNTAGIFEFEFDYNGESGEFINFVILKEIDNELSFVNLFDYVNNTEKNDFASFILDEINNNCLINLKLDVGDKIYIGYYNCNNYGSYELNISRIIYNKFNIITDVNQNVVVGSEVTLNGGIYQGTSISQGYTRICYLGNDAPDKTSRQKYYWISSNTDVAIVSSFGTITAISSGKVIITAVYSENYSIVANILIEVKGIQPMNDKYLSYGMDNRTGGTISGTEVTSGLGEKIEIGFHSEISIHIGYTRLICLGNDSPSTSVQDFEWEVIRESQIDKGMVTVSQWGTIKGVTAGNITIIGRYKYNNYYLVKIKLIVK